MSSYVTIFKAKIHKLERRFVRNAAKMARAAKISAQLDDEGNEGDHELYTMGDLMDKLDAVIISLRAAQEKARAAIVFLSERRYHPIFDPADNRTTIRNLCNAYDQELNGLERVASAQVAVLHSATVLMYIQHQIKDKVESQLEQVELFKRKLLEQ